MATPSGSPAGSPRSPLTQYLNPRFNMPGPWLPYAYMYPRRALHLHAIAQRSACVHDCAPSPAVLDHYPVISPLLVNPCRPPVTMPFASALPAPPPSSGAPPPRHAGLPYLPSPPALTRPHAILGAARHEERPGRERHYLQQVGGCLEPEAAAERSASMGGWGVTPELPHDTIYTFKVGQGGRSMQMRAARRRHLHAVGETVI